MIKIYNQEYCNKYCNGYNSTTSEDGIWVGNIHYTEFSITCRRNPSFDMQPIVTAEQRKIRLILRGRYNDLQKELPEHKDIMAKLREYDIAYNFAMSRIHSLIGIPRKLIGDGK